MKILFCVLLWCALLAPPAPTLAQSWPSRPVKLMVPTGPGAATDVMARLLADGVSRTLGQPMVVENLPGASGILAHQAVARAAPDGYTLMMAIDSTLVMNQFLYKSLPYDPFNDFAPISLTTQTVSVLAVRADGPKDVPDLIAPAKDLAEPCRHSLRMIGRHVREERPDQRILGNVLGIKDPCHRCQRRQAPGPSPARRQAAHRRQPESVL